MHAKICFYEEKSNHTPLAHIAYPMIAITNSIFKNYIVILGKYLCVYEENTLGLAKKKLHLNYVKTELSLMESEFTGRCLLFTKGKNTSGRKVFRCVMLCLWYLESKL